MTMIPKLILFPADLLSHLETEAQRDAEKTGGQPNVSATIRRLLIAALRKKGLTSTDSGV